MHYQVFFRRIPKIFVFKNFEKAVYLFRSFDWMIQYADLKMVQDFYRTCSLFVCNTRDRNLIGVDMETGLFGALIGITWKQVVMMLVGATLIYLAVKKNY
ncbi:MAG: hypothetical protein COT43_00005, partial [Candidatus Marinimicrobia bacterium CG08_land_8_20_14_0_20_45_22]